MSRTVPQRSYPALSGAGFDRCYTPWHGAAPLLPYLPCFPPQTRIWEPCAGGGWLATWLREAGHAVIETDYVTGQDALRWAPDPSSYDIIVTNPPWSLKYKFLARFFQLGKPWAMLVPYVMPGTSTARRIRDAAAGTWEELRLDKRINFFMPGSGFENNGAQLPVLWLCSGILPRPLVEELVPEPRPEHRLVKPPKKPKRPNPTAADILRWVNARGYGADVAALVAEAIQHGIPPEEQATFL